MKPMFMPRPPAGWELRVSRDTKTNDLLFRLLGDGKEYAEAISQRVIATDSIGPMQIYQRLEAQAGIVFDWTD